MSPVLLYIARASLYLALFYAFFLLVMRRTSLFRFNRIALLAGTVICHLLPLLRLRNAMLFTIRHPRRVLLSVALQLVWLLALVLFVPQTLLP